MTKSQSMFSINLICVERIGWVLKYLSFLISANRIPRNLILATLIPTTLIGLTAPVWAQSPAPSSTTTGTLRGQVTDPSGAVVPSATVAVMVSGGQSHSATTNRSGGYEIGNLAPGKYTVTANAQGFAVFVQNDVDVVAGRVAQFNISLDINVEKEKVNVQEEGPQLDVNPSNNASAIVLNGKDLEALPDDPDELQSDLEALAGPSAGPNGGQLYIDGFTGGQLPPKSSIREIRVNQNPFSAEYDKLGYGRIEVFTKPGTDKYHGQFSVEGNSSAMNSRNPFLGIAVVNATVLGANSLPTTFNASVPNPRTRTNIGPRIDYQISPDNTLTGRYQFYRDTQQNAGVGNQVLPEAGYDTTSTEHTVQISDTQIIGAKAVNETRFQYLRDTSGQTPLSTAIGINVLGNFVGGGSGSGSQSDHQNRYELQNYTSISQGKHFVKFGGRLRAAHEVNLSSAGFNGTYTFPDLTTAYANGIPSQYSVNATPSGAPANVPVTMVDVGLYAQDDWKVRPNFTLSGGLRFETQNAIHDHADWAPRLGFAWGIGGGGKSAPKTVLRGGFGLFYDRFAQDLILNTDRLNGVTEQQYVVSSPTYPTPPPVNTLPATTQATYQINSQLHAPYIMQTAFSLERQVTKIANVTVSYLNARGVHQFLSQNVNAPPPGTPFSSGPLPNPAAGPIYQYVSDGIFRQNQLIANFNIRAGAKLSLFGYYSLNYANSDASGASSFPSNQYDLANVTVGQDLSNDSLFNDRPGFSPNVSGACVSPRLACHYVIPTSSYDPIPINYLTGPAHFTLNLRLAKTFGFGPEVGGKNGAQTSEGPGGGGPFGGGGPRGGGFGRGPGGGGFGGGGAASTRRYSLTFSVNARNILNKVNAATPVGVLSSPNFGQSIALAGGPFSSAAANRKIELQAMFSF